MAFMEGFRHHNTIEGVYSLGPSDPTESREGLRTLRREQQARPSHRFGGRVREWTLPPLTR